MTRAIVAVLCLWAAVAAVAADAPWADGAAVESLSAELGEFLRGSETRFPGSPGNLAMEEKVSALFKSSGLPNGAIKFRVACFVPGEATITLNGGVSARLRPMHPTAARPGNFPEKEFSAPLVYLGRGANADLERVKGTAVENALVLMEFDCGTDWLRLLRFGVKGFIFIEPERYDPSDAFAKVCNTEVNLPRFLVSRAEGEALKAALAPSAAARVKAIPSRLENKILRNLWVLIPGASPDQAREVAMIVAPIDSNCIVPELAAGAESGANLFLLKRLFDDFRLNPPARSVLLVAVNARVNANQGERMLAWHTLAGESEREQLRDTLNDDLRAELALVEYHKRLKLDAWNKETEDILVNWRSLIDETTSRNITVKNSVVSLAKRDVNRLKNDRLILVRKNLPKAEFARLDAEIQKRQKMHVKVLTLFNKVGVRTKLGDLAPEELEILRGYVREVIEFNSLCAELNGQDLALENENDAIREALKGNKIAFVISLALDFTSPRVGFFAGQRPTWAQRWGANSTAIAEALEGVAAGKPNLLEDTLTMRGGFGPGYYFRSAAEFPNAGQTPTFTLMNVFPAQGHAFLPSDTLANLDKSHFANSAFFLKDYLRALLSAPHITDPSELNTSMINRGQAPMMAIQVKTFKFNEFSATVVPDVPVPDTVVVLNVNQPGYKVYGRPFQSSCMLGEVCQSRIMLTDRRAATVFYGLNLSRTQRKGERTTIAYHCDPDFIAVDHAIDAGEAQKKMSSDEFYTDVTLNLFECHEMPIYATADSSLIAGSPIFAESIIPVTAKGNTSPRKYGLTGVRSALSPKTATLSAGGPAAFYFSRGEKVKFITGNKRLALNATPEEFEGRGYESAAELGPDFFRNVVADMSVLNRARMNKMKDVTNDLVKEFADRGDRCLGAMLSALAGNDYLAGLRKLYEGLGAHTKSYEQTKQTNDDMLKAIVVYMALLLPFCFFIQKLLFNFVKIEHELGMFAALFVIAFLIFREIHPAFRVAQAAEAIFIAFVMGALGLFVISILRGRFEGEMQLLFRSYMSGTMDEAAYSTVTQKAMLIGVNNMKRRRVRTLLTTMTIVLIAFAMLSFTSISKKINPTIVHKTLVPPYTGFMFQWPGKSQMEEATYAVMRDLFASFGQVATRRWKVMSATDNTPFKAFFSNGHETTVDALLGLSTVEDGFIRKIPIIGGRYFSADSATEALVSAQMAENLGIDPNKLAGVRVRCGGYDLDVVGVYDDDKIKSLVDLNGISILPIKRISQATSAFGAEAEVHEELDSLGVLFFVDPLSLLIVPDDIARRMGAFPFSVSVKMKDDAPVWPLMDVILTSTMAKFYMSSLVPFAIGADGRKAVSPGVYYIGSNYKTSIGGLAVLLIPLFIAGTIIFNTMLGSVYERKKEIAVYNAIGLNPHHIGLFFLAESFVYGVIGSVGGYLIGQLLSIAINATGLVKGINFNYSSLSVAYVIIFTIAIVLLSTIYPAMAAVRTAVPSGKRTWSMPASTGNAMEVVFPFIYQPGIASGILAYLHEYFARFTEVSIGDLIANRLAHSCARDAAGHERYKLDYHVALAPYDLGVTEDLRFDLAYDEYVQAYRLVLKIERVSGQDVNWVTTNRPFLERLRKYLMRWRNLDLNQQQFYVKQACDSLARN